jgi:ribonuclease J
MTIKCFPVDHSIPGACAWAIETDSGWVVYSGDLRLHGKKSEVTRAFIRQAAALKPRALILEGTNVHRDANISEQQVFENGLKAISRAKSLVIADFPARDVDRLLTFLEIAKQCHRKLAILPRDAYLLKTMRLLDPSIPDVTTRDGPIVIYQETTASRNPAMWLRQICQECEATVVVADDVRKAQDQFVLCFSFFDINELPSIRPAHGSLYVFSSSEPHDEEQEIDFRRLHRWLDHHRITSVGLPVEEHGRWEIPEDERGLHASGHACGPDLLQIAREISPQIIVPVHTQYPDFYAGHLAGSGISVTVPSIGDRITI